jgi:hypothetical protein
MSWQEFKYVWGFEERPHNPVTHVNNENGILVAGNYVYDSRQRGDEHYVVDLPPYEMNVEDKLYAQYLLDHPHKNVEVNFTEHELWGGNSPVIVPLNYGEKSPIEMDEEEYQEWIDQKRGCV